MNEIIRKFIEEHGNSIGHNGWIYHEDGARREASSHGTLQRPPEDPQQRAKAIAYYWQLVAERAETEFVEFQQQIKNHYQDALTHRYTLPPTGHREALAQLKELHKKAVRAKRAYAAADKAYRNHRSPEDTARELASEKAKAAHSEVLAQIDAFKL